MPFQPLPEGKGMIYIPPRRDIEKKHPCPDCFSCLNCADDRCRLCRGSAIHCAGPNKRNRKKETG